MKILKKYRQAQGGFTFLEVMVVVAILALLAAIIIPRFTGRAEDAKIKSCQMQIAEISKALELYKLDNGFYPTTEQGLKALYERPETEPEPKKWKEQYVDSIPKDPWEGEFVYIQPGNYRDFDLYSMGPDGQESEDDIKNWTKEDEERRK
jgi:general secretion pathway protein G